MSLSGTSKPLDNEPAHVARRIVRAVSQCRTDGQLEFVRRYALLASRRYGTDLMPLLALQGQIKSVLEDIEVECPNCGEMVPGLFFNEVYGVEHCGCFWDGEPEKVIYHAYNMPELTEEEKEGFGFDEED